VQRLAGGGLANVGFLGGDFDQFSFVHLPFLPFVERRPNGLGRILATTRKKSARFFLTGACEALRYNDPATVFPSPHPHFPGVSIHVVS
ncbi:MAG TPA: hypothetical protein VL381_07985, partial [Rhodocyclaceae bacterium]|nr:hypothetical protein [Rhodocyclaceae bacterium]